MTQMNYSSLSVPQISQFINLKNYYKQTPVSNEFQCKFCYRIVKKSTYNCEQMYMHLIRTHAYELDENKINSYYELVRTLKIAPKYLKKYEHMNLISDEWFDRLAIDGYPVNQIASSIFRRLKQNKAQFCKYLIQRAAQISSNKHQILKFLPSLPLILLPQQIAEIIHNNFKIEKDAAHLILDDYFWANQSEARIIEKLQDNNFFVKSFKECHSHTVIMITNQKMKKNYYEFGEYVNLQFRFNPLKRAKSGKHYCIGVFFGQDTNIRPVLFSIALVNGENPLYYEKCVRMFIEMMENIVPFVFITNDSLAMEDSLNKVKKETRYKFKQMSNWSYIIGKLKRQFDTDFQPQLLVDMCCNAMSSLTKNEYEIIMKEIKSKVTIDKILSFELGKKKYCMSQSQPSFIGFGIQSERASQMTKAISENFKYQENVGIFFIYLIKFMSYMQQKYEKKHQFMNSLEIQDQDPSTELIYLSKMVEKSIFKKLFYLYKRSQDPVEIEEQPLQYKLIYSKEQEESHTLVYKVRYDLVDDCWKCSCGLIYWSGLPCAHIIRIVRMQKGCLAYYINSRWIVNQWVEEMKEFIEEQERQDSLCSLQELYMNTEKEQ